MSTAADPNPRAPLTRERILETALRLADDGGIEALSMRKLGQALGFEAMSLYHHVRDKDDLLQGVCERIMSSFRFPATSGEWVDRAKAGAGEWRRLLQAHPDVMRIFAETHGPAPSSPESLLPTEFALRLFMEAGLSDRDAVQAFHAFGGYIQGFVMMEAGSMKERHEEHFLGAAIPPEEFPALAAASRYWADCDADEQFEFGLDLLIRGLQAKVGAASTRSRTE